MKETKQNW